MLLKLRSNNNVIINFLVVALLSSFTIFTSYTWGRYVVLLCLFLILGVQLLRDGGRYTIAFDVFPTIALTFALYAMMSSLWAERPEESISTGKTLFEILLMIFILYNCYVNNEHNTTDLLLCIKWSSYTVALYSIIFYGYEQLIIMGISGERLENQYANVNTIGMMAAIGIVIQIDEVLRERRWKWAALFCAPSVFVLAVTQSRKALVVMLCGCVMVLLYRIRGSKNQIKTLLSMFMWGTIAAVAVYLLFSSPFFSGILERMDSMLNAFIGDGEMDHSAAFRLDMIEIGWQQFLKTPIGGIGMGNSHLIALHHFGIDAYLHNNFVELLVGGGIIGFAIYYSMYAYLLAMFWKYRKFQDAEYITCLIIMVILLAMDYGLVSYYDKGRWVYLMVYFLEAHRIKRRAQRSLKEVRTDA